MQSQHKQIPLISSKIKGSKIEYQVQKQGIIFLRQLRNKKFRIIFNIVGQDQNAKGQNRQALRIVDQFNRLLLCENYGNQSQQGKKYTGFQKQQNEYQKKQSSSPYLNIHPNFKLISQNRVIVIMNCCIPPHSPPYLLIFGYLISSLVLYHNFLNEFSSQSPLTYLLCQFSKLLRATNIDQLNENIKFKTGYEKTPYLLCLLSKSEQGSKSYKQILFQKREYQSMLNDFYRFREQQQHSKINYALETIIDYFPERASLGIQMTKNNKSQQKLTQVGQNQVTELGHQFEKTILGRQLFTFQFTSTIIQSLAFELCYYFNTEKQLNLIQLYNSVIDNKKARLQIQYCHRYLQLVREKVFLGNKIQLQEVQMIQDGKSIFPVGDLVLVKILQQIKEIIKQEMLNDAVNCMELWEFIISQKKVTQKIKEYQQKLLRINAQCGKRFVEECYGLIELGEDDVELVTEIDQHQQLINQGISLSKSQQGSENKQKNLQLAKTQQINQLFTILTSRLESFTNECSSMFTHEDLNSQRYSQTFNKLANSYLKIIGKKLQETVQKVEIKFREQQLQSNTLRYQLNKSSKQKKLLQQQYELQLLIETELKQQLQSLILSTQLNANNQPLLLKQDSNKMINQQANHFIATQKEIYKLKQKIQLLEQQLRQKNNHIEDLSEVLNKFQSTCKSLTDNKYADRFTTMTKNLIEQANTKIKQFYTILQQVKQVEKHYENAKKLLLKEKNKILQQKKQSFKQIQNAKQQAQKVKLENKKLYEIVVEEKKAIDNFTTLKQTLKHHIAELQAANTQLTCSLAQQQSDKQLYRKALSLVVENNQKGKSQNLSKFYKFLQHQQIKEMIKPILGKK